MKTKSIINKINIVTPNNKSNSPILISDIQKNKKLSKLSLYSVYSSSIPRCK